MREMARIVREADGCARLLAEIKRRAMEYQFNLKVICASELGLTYDDVNLPYQEWAKLRDAWEAWRT